MHPATESWQQTIPHDLLSTWSIPEGEPPPGHILKGFEHAKEILGEYFTLPPLSKNQRESDACPPPQDEHQTSQSSNSPPQGKEPASTPTMPPHQEVFKPDATPLTPQSPWPSNLIAVIKTIVSKPCDRPARPEFSFSFDMESAEKNYIILMKKHGGSLKRALDANSNSPLGMGSEFRPIKSIEPLYQHHPIWPRTKKILTDGSHWPLEELPEEQRAADVEEAIEFGNHKGANNDPTLLHELVAKDIKYGYCIPLPLRKAKQIPKILFAPMNIQHQNTIDETGKIIDKERLTHDQSYRWSGSGTSVNSRVMKEELMPCMYGMCLRRLINWTVAARRKYPGHRIFASKIDFKSAFRRCNLSAETAMQCCTQLPADELILLYLRLTFGGCPCPNEWGAFSEPICDLATAIMHDDLWNPEELHSPIQHLVPPPKAMDDDVPFGVGKELIVDIDVNSRGIHDVYIDDMIPLGIDIPGTDNLKRCEAASLLAIDATARPIHPQEPIPREEMVARNKFFAEAGLEETKIILGWLLDFRRLIISLPSNKFIAWTDSINDLLARGTTTAKELETTIGRLGHLGAIMPFVYHFLSRLRNLQRRAISRRTIGIPQDCREDLELMLSFLHKAYSGIDMNLIAFRRPTHIYRSDSCPYGLGGYSHDGFAWRFELPDDCRFRASNNLLEFIASIVTPWIDLISKRLRPGDCALSMTDSTTSAGWLKKTNFLEEGSDPIEETVRLEIARKHASHFTHHNIKEYSQWFPGKKNNIADSLSRDFDLDDAELSKYLHLHYPSQLPPHFQVVRIPSEIESWLTSLLLRLPVKEQLRELHMTTRQEPIDDGKSTSSPSVSGTTPSSTISQDVNGTSSSAPSPQQFEKEDFQAILSKPWLQEQSEIPFRVYVRPSGSTDARTHQKTKTFNLVSFYSDNTDHTPTTTQNRSNKKPSPCASSQRSESDGAQSYSEQSESSPPWQSSSQCVRASTSRSPKQRRDGPTSFASATSDFSRTEN